MKSREHLVYAACGWDGVVAQSQVHNVLVSLA